LLALGTEEAAPHRLQYLIGETEQRLYVIAAWREAPHLFSSRERAALPGQKR
jgi:alkylhydroperoxidase family enzyme